MNIKRINEMKHTNASKSKRNKESPNTITKRKRHQKDTHKNKKYSKIKNKK
jgi:hypothetical protein